MSFTGLQSRVGLGYLASLLILYVIYSCVYRCFVHPLKRVPGPWLNKMSALPIAIHTWRGLPHTYFYSLHQKYGMLKQNYQLVC
jgi:hypothetical protein